MNTPVNFEIAKLLKEKGYDELCGSYYSKYNPEAIETNTKCSNKRIAESCCTAPTIADVVMWLYEKHGIWINVTSDYNRFFTWQYRITSRNKTIGKDGIIYNEGFNSPTEAYEVAIKYVLKNLIK